MRSVLLYVLCHVVGAWKTGNRMVDLTAVGSVICSTTAAGTCSALSVFFLSV